MADAYYTAVSAIENRESFYNVIRKTGQTTTPFWSSISSAPFNGDPSKMHKWDYRPGPQAGAANKHAEGGVRADVTKWDALELGNYLQIFKKTSGITGSQKEGLTIENQKASIRDQKVNNRTQLRFDIEAAMLSATAPATADVGGQQVRTMGGIKHFVNAGMTIDGGGLVALDYKTHIAELLKQMFLNGVTEQKTIMVGADVKSSINDILQTNKRYGGNDKSYTENVTMIEDSGWGTKIPIITNPHLAADEMLIYAPSLINSVLLRSIKDREVTDPNYDAEAYEDLFELSIRMLDPLACAWVKGLDV